MSRCGLEDLDGLSSMNHLRELYLAYNEIYDISPCSMLEHLKILDLEGYVKILLFHIGYVKILLFHILHRLIFHDAYFRTAFSSRNISNTCKCFSILFYTEKLDCFFFFSFCKG